MRRTNNELYEPISDINVTPCVDVLLVLLVVFMITAPLFKKAIDVQLPRENLRSSSVKDARKLVISINRNGVYYIEGRHYPTRRLLEKLVEWREKNPDETVFIRGDERTSYGSIASLMVLLKNNGIYQLGLLVEDKKN